MAKAKKTATKATQKVAKTKRATKKVATKKVAAKKVATKNVTKKKVVMAEPLVMQSPRGMRDLLPGEQSYWQQVRKVIERGALEYGFQRIDTPVVEFENLFTRTVGEGTDIVDKEMYTFMTKGRDKVTLRPEFTAAIARAYIQHGMNVLPKPVRLFTMGPLYRYDRPQQGRYRELWQADFEVFGEEDAVLDAQVIQLAYRTLQSLGIKNIQFQVNTLGTAEARKEYKELLTQYFQSKRAKLPQHYRDMIEKNPIRILDSKDEKCMQVSAGAPQLIDHLDTASRDHFKHVLEYLDELDLPYVLNPQLVRGLDYYTKTVFEIWVDEEGGKKNALGGGGRYDRLIETLGGESTPAIGFALGLDRIVLEMKRIKAKEYHPPKPRVYLAQLGDLAKKKSLRLFAELEKNGILIAESFGRGALKAQLRHADKIGVEVTLIIGQKEALDATVIVKNMNTGNQETVAVEKVIDLVKKYLKTPVKVSRKKKK